MTRKRWLLYLASLIPVATLIALLAWSQVRSDGNLGGLLVNSEPGVATVPARPAPAFTLALASLENELLLNSSSLQGKVVMLDFWSSWCPPCRAEAAELATVYREYEGQPVEFVGIAVWDNLGDILQHLSRFEVTYPNGLDARGVIAIDYGVRGIPEKYFLDQKGVIVKKYVGPISNEVLRETLDTLLAAS